MKGRTPPVLPEVILHDSGYTVQIRSIGPTTLEALGQAVRKSLPGKPEPPLNIVTGLDGQPSQEPNPADPDYEAALAVYEEQVQAEVGARLMELMRTYAVRYEVDPETLAEFRAAMQAAGVELEDDNREVWWKHFILNSQADAQQLVSAVLRQSGPTEEAIQEKVASFPGDVPGS